MASRILKHIVYTYLARRGPLLAKGIAYSLLLGVTPLLLLSLAAASMFYQYIPAIEDRLSVRLAEFVPDAISEPILRQVQAVAGSWAGMSLLGAAMLVFVSKGMFDALASGLAGVMGGTPRRGAFVRHALSLIMTVLATAFVVVSSLDTFIITMMLKTAGVPRSRLLYSSGALLITILLLAFVLVLVYALFSTKPVAPKRVLATAAGISIFWHALGRLGKFLVLLSARYNVMYGVFGGAVLFLVWLQLFAHLVLLGGLLIAREEKPVTPEMTARAALDAARNTGEHDMSKPDALAT